VIHLRGIWGWDGYLHWYACLCSFGANHTEKELNTFQEAR
jgi:hypothetical protein